MPYAATGVWTPKHLAANASTLLKGYSSDTSYPRLSSGILHAVTINTKGATGNILTLYDGLDNTGAVLAIIDTTAVVGQLVYDVSFDLGLFAVLTTGTAADITVAFS